jgi:hypothetical protein
VDPEKLALQELHGILDKLRTDYSPREVLVSHEMTLYSGLLSRARRLSVLYRDAYKALSPEDQCLIQNGIVGIRLGA